MTVNASSVVTDSATARVESPGYNAKVVALVGPMMTVPMDFQISCVRFVTFEYRFQRSEQFINMKPVMCWSWL